LRAIGNGGVEHAIRSFAWRKRNASLCGREPLSRVPQASRLLGGTSQARGLRDPRGRGHHHDAVPGELL